MSKLQTTYMGLKLKSPIIAASCGLTNKLNDLIALEQSGAGAIVLKSLFEEEIVMELERDQNKMHSESYLYPETMEFYENYDTEDTLTNYLKLISDAKQHLSIPIIASINCVTPHNWFYFAETLQDAGVDALELNVFILPSDASKPGHEYEETYFKIAKTLQSQIRIPWSLKIAPYFSGMSSMIKRLSETGASALTLFNRFYSVDFDIDQLETVSAHTFSTPGDYLTTLRWIGLTSAHVSCDLSASTGIHDSRTAIKMILAGAKTVQVASTLYKHGIKQIADINREIEVWMKQKNFDSIDQFRGLLAHSPHTNPAGYLRLQFMKHFSEK